MPKVSIIVPIYNVEKYLKECLDSLLNQTLKDIEIICINDGSTDESLNILKEYEHKDARIKIIDKENSGYGISMNIGLEKAQGEYIGIIESDDFAKENMFENLYKKASENNADVVKSDFYYYTSDKKESRQAGKILKSKCGKVFSVKEDSSILKIMPTIWSAIYKRSFLRENNIKFLETAGASYQDTSFAFKVLSLAKRIVFTDKAYVFYRQDNVNSSVHSKSKVYNICSEYDEITAFLDKNPQIKEIVNTTKLIKQYAAYMWNLKRIDKEFRKDFIDVFSETFKDFYHNKDIKPKFYSKINILEFYVLIYNKSLFEKLVETRVKKDINKNNRRKMFSIRINSSRVSIVLFGKQILEIG